LTYARAIPGFSACKYSDHRIQHFFPYGILFVVVSDAYFQKLCDQLRDASGQENIQRAAEALRHYLQDQQFIIRQRLSPYVEKAFLAALESDEYQSN
jgi:hypothetical protein